MAITNEEMIKPRCLACEARMKQEQIKEDFEYADIYGAIANHHMRYGDDNRARFNAYLAAHHARQAIRLEEELAVQELGSEPATANGTERGSISKNSVSNYAPIGSGRR